MSRRPLAVAGAALLAAAASQPGASTAAPAATAKAEKVRVCHFPHSGGAQLLEVSDHALPAHLTHGDVPAPPSVRTAEDCLVPQPPPGPVAASAITDSAGLASFLIPDTNIVAKVTVADAAGDPISGVTTQLHVVGTEYLLIAADQTLRHAPAFAAGGLSEARPGSAVQLAIHLVLQTFTSTIPGVGFLRTSNLSFPSFVRSHFSPSVQCFARDELEAFLASACGSAFSVVSGVLVGQFQVIGWITAAGQQTLDQLLADTLSSSFCPALADQSATATFSGKHLPLELRVYNPPLLPGVKIFPIFFEEIGTCGGGCCVAQGAQCELASSPTRCAAVGGSFKLGVPCTPSPCAPPPTHGTLTCTESFNWVQKRSSGTPFGLEWNCVGSYNWTCDVKGQTVSLQIASYVNNHCLGPTCSRRDKTQISSITRLSRPRGPLSTTFAPPPDDWSSGTGIWDGFPTITATATVDGETFAKTLTPICPSPP